MESGKKFSVLLIINATEELESLCNMIKRHFPRFYTASTEEDALHLIAEHQIDILLMGLNGIQKNEVFYLHLLSAKQNVEQVLFRKILFCSRDELKDAFAICNKDVFDDYFIVRPLYDPYHLLLRLRTLHRVQGERESRDFLSTGNCSVENLCQYFDQIIHCDSDIADLNKDNYGKLKELVSFSMEQMKEKIMGGEDLAETSRKNISSLIDNHAEEHMQEVERHQKSAHQDVENKLNGISDLAKQKKISLAAETDNIVVFDDSNILLLEDEVEVRDKVKSFLEGAGYKVQVSGCATHTIKLLKSWKPELVLLDLTLPDMSSLFVIDQIKQDPDMQKTRIMVMSAPGDMQNAKEAMKLGVHEVMMKPVDKDMLLFKVSHNLEAIQLVTSE